MKFGPFLAVILILLAPMAMLYTLWIDPLSAGEDDLGYYYPLRVLVGQSLAKGQWPQHNPLEATGVPLMADPQAGVLHPPTWLFASLPARQAYSLNLFLAFSLAGLGAWLYLRKLKLVAPAAALGSVAFMFSGFMVGHRVHLSIIQTACMLPWGLWCVEWMRQRRGRAGALVALVPVVLMALTAGHWPTMIHVTLIWGVYLLLRGRPLLPAVATAALAMSLAAAIAWPQIDATRQWMAQATRERIGYAMAGENSFYPGAGVLAFFPFLYGSRTPGVFPQAWWGPWHLCEMLGYVGLLTLVLAGAAIWKLQPDDFWRRVGLRQLIAVVRRLRTGRRRRTEAVANPPDPTTTTNAEQAQPLNRSVPEAASMPPRPACELPPLVRVWTWLLIGAAIWMLGYYLPTYRLIHKLPVLGVVRCPARMVLAVDMGLAVLAAVAVHAAVIRAREGAAGPDPLLAGVRRLARVTLPVAMAACLAVIVVGAVVVGTFFPQGLPGMEFWGGGPAQAWQALMPTNPALLVPIAFLLLTVAAVCFWSVAPARRAALLPLLLLSDLFVIARFVDVPPVSRLVRDEGPRPAAQFLLQRQQAGEHFRIWSLADSYHDRPRDLLLPKYCQSLGLATIGNYGPLQSPHHAHVLGLRIFGTCDDWANLLRKNHLLSLYNVRYILAAEPKFREVIESVRIPDALAPPPGADVLTGRWDPENAEVVDGVLRLRTSFMWRWSIAWHPVRLAAGQTYRLSLEARSEAGGAGNFVRAEFFRKGPGWSYFTEPRLGLSVHPEHLGPQWRRFEWWFQAPAPGVGEDFLRVFTMSERAIEVRSVSLRFDSLPAPVDLTGRLEPGQSVYRRVYPQGDVAAGPGQEPPVCIYENRLCLGEQPRVAPTPEGIEGLRRLDASSRGLPEVPDLAVRLARSPERAVRAVMMPAVGAYAVLAGLALLLGLRRNG